MDEIDLDQRLDAILAVEAYEKNDHEAMKAVIAANEQDIGRLVTALARLVAWTAHLYAHELDDDDLKATCVPLLRELRDEVLERER